MLGEVAPPRLADGVAGEQPPRHVADLAQDGERDDAPARVARHAERVRHALPPRPHLGDLPGALVAGRGPPAPGAGVRPPAPGPAVLRAGRGGGPAPQRPPAPRGHGGPPGPAPRPRPAG